MGILDGFTKAQESGKSTVKKVGIGGYSMFARVNDSTDYPSQVPVDVLEDGSNASDDIINGPITIKISGVVADVYVDAKPNAALSLLPDYSRYGEVLEYIPAKTQQQLQKINEIADRAEQKILEAKRLADKGAELFGLVGNPVAGGAKGIREQFLDFIEAIYYGKQLISVEVDYRTHENMALSGLTISTDNQTQDTKFEASFTKINFTKLTTTAIEQQFKSPSPAAKSKTAGVANKGTQTPADNSKTRSGASRAKSVATSVKEAILGK
ncbi:phage baseplate protein [Kluyvera intermedia]|uniref:phage baseplate protein n=1 Tax=Kluyvera intermedia TaxID=61648 RepID=UPI0039F50AC9